MYKTRIWDSGLVKWHRVDGLKSKSTQNPGWSHSWCFDFSPYLTSSHPTVPTVWVPASPPLSDDNFLPLGEKCSWLIYPRLKKKTKKKTIPHSPPPAFCFISLLLWMVNEVNRVVSVVFGEELAGSWDDKISEVQVLLWTSCWATVPSPIRGKGCTLFKFCSCGFAFFSHPQETLIQFLNFKHA